MFLDKCSTTDIDLSYTFNFKVPKSLTIGLSIYNVFSAEYDNNGWAAPQLTNDNDTIKAVNAWGIRDNGAAGFAPSAPFNVMAHLSMTF